MRRSQRWMLEPDDCGVTFWHRHVGKGSTQFMLTATKGRRGWTAAFFLPDHRLVKVKGVFPTDGRARHAAEHGLKCWLSEVGKLV